MEAFNTFILQYEKASAIVISSAIPQALWLGILSLPSDNMSHAIGSMASAKFKNNMTDSLSKSTMIALTIADLECPIQRFWKTGVIMETVCKHSCYLTRRLMKAYA
ncbi:MAG: hypothetical protein ACTTJG_07045, partial [Treponema sp.]